MLKPYNKVETLDRDTLALDKDFINDASLFLRGRLRDEEVKTPYEIYDTFMEHMRYHDVNEVTTLRDLEYAQRATPEEKEAFGRLIDAYDKVDEDFSARMLGDYAAAVMTAPSTYAGLATGGTGKLATMAGVQAAKLGVRRILAEGAKSAGRAAIVEGAIGAGQGAMQEATRVKTGIQDEFTGGRTAVTGVASAVTGGLLNFPVGMVQAKQASKANEILEQSRLAATERAGIAAEKSEEVLAKGNIEEIENIRKTLNALDPDEVFQGRRLRQQLMKADTMEAALGPEVVQNITAAAIRVKEKIKLKEGERITSGIYRLLKEDELGEIKEVSNILREHNLNLDQFSLIYLAEISDAGRTLGQHGMVKRLLSEVDELNRGGKSAISKDEAEAFTSGRKAMNKAYQMFKDFDTLGIASLTVQPATTMRNTIGGGLRVGIDAATRTMDNVIQNGVALATFGQKASFRNPLDGTFDVAKLLFNPYEARAMRTLLEEQFPNESAKLFREAADLAAVTKDESALVKLGRKMNVLNTMSDNMFKGAVISASLKRQLKDKTGKSLVDVMKNAEFEEITDDMFKKAIEDAYKFTYQSSDVGPVGRFAIDMQKKLPFLVSSVMPFPRFVANQLKFQYEHMPLIGMMRLFNNPARDVFSKQMTGVGMLSAAYMWRVQQGPEAEWFEIKKNEDDYFNGKAVYGPMAPFMVAADMIYRMQTKTMPMNWMQYYGRATAEATLGSTFRTGFGLAAIDKLFDGSIANMRLERETAGFAGDLLGRYMIPLGGFGIAKDAYPLLFDDQRAANIPATRTGDEVNWFDYLYKTATRSLPDLPIASLTDGTVASKDYDSPAVSPFQTGTLRPIDPLEKHVLGATTFRKNAIQKEMSRLGLVYFDLYRRDRDDKIDFYTRQELSRRGGEYNANVRMTLLFDDPIYKEASDIGKQKLLKQEFGQIVSGAKEFAKNRLDKEAQIKGEPYSRVDIANWDSATKAERAEVNEIFAQEYGGTDVNDQKDLYMTVNGRRTNVMLWANMALKALRGPQ